MGVKTDIFDRVDAILQEIRPVLVADGGDVQLVRVENNTAYIRLLGACSTCPLAGITVKLTIEQELKKRMPEIETVEIAQ